MMDNEYVCDLVSKEDLDNYSWLVFSFSEGWEVDKFLLRELEKYGSSFIIVYDNMNSHFRECAECRTYYGKKLVIHRKIALETGVFDTDDMEEIRNKVYKAVQNEKKVLTAEKITDEQMKRFLRNVLKDDEEKDDDDPKSKS